MANAHNLKRRNPWPRAAGQQRARVEEIATGHAENLRDTLRRIAVMKLAHPDLVTKLIEIERDVAIAALAFDDIRLLMQEAGMAVAQAVAPGPVDRPDVGG